MQLTKGPAWRAGWLSQHAGGLSEETEHGEAQHSARRHAGHVPESVSGAVARDLACNVLRIVAQRDDCRLLSAPLGPLSKSACNRQHVKIGDTY